MNTLLEVQEGNFTNFLNRETVKEMAVNSGFKCKNRLPDHCRCKKCCDEPLKRDIRSRVYHFADQISFAVQNEEMLNLAQRTKNLTSFESAEKAIEEYLVSVTNVLTEAKTEDFQKIAKQILAVSMNAFSEKRLEEIMQAEHRRRLGNN